MITTPHGEFKIIRKGTVAISVVRAERRVRHHRVEYVEGDLMHIEHRKIPKYLHKITFSWASHVATYDMDGNRLDLQT